MSKAVVFYASLLASVVGLSGLALAGCDPYCDPNCGDPVFVQKDRRDMAGLARARRLKQSPMHGGTIEKEVQIAEPEQKGMDTAHGDVSSGSGPETGLKPRKRQEPRSGQDRATKAVRPLGGRRL